MGMVVCCRVMLVHVPASVHAVMSMLGNLNAVDRHRLTRAQHGSRHRTPDRQQDGEQDQDEGAEVLHCE